MSEPDSTIIGAKNCGDWRAIRPTLVPGQSPELWKKAFDDFFQSRLRLRYLDPIAVLQNHDTQQGEGFSIVALHCSLIEFLESTLEGLTYRYVKRDSDLGPHEYRKSGELFERFLSTRTPFKNAFSQSLAHDFYENIRCAVLHEARTKGGWRIWANGPNGKIVDEGRRILYRNNCNDALLEYVDWYGTHLISDSAAQEAFLRKFESLCA